MHAWLLLSVTLPTGLFVTAALALVFLIAFLLSGLFGPTPKYEIADRDELAANDSDDFLRLLESMADARANRTGDLEVLTNGEAFYAATLAAMRSAQHSIDLEAYIFHESVIAQKYVDVLTERAQAGVRVNLTFDTIGCASLRRSYLEPLLRAGGQLAWYNRPAWHNLTKLDNRTHRELLIVDGRTGFIGGAGVADQWYASTGKDPRWRDTVIRVEGPAVANLQATFAENWLTSSGRLLAGGRYFPELACDNSIVAMVINSTPTTGGSTRARVLFQLLLASAQHSITITTPYFLPDKSLTRELCRAIEERGVKLRILVPGRKADHLVTRSTSRAGYGPLLKAGAEVYEYQPAMIHAKVLVVDGLWAVVGSTNFDNRSFGINDEVNLAVRDAAFAQRLETDTAADIRESRSISLDEWKRRPISERAPELLGWIFERQQ